MFTELSLMQNCMALGANKHTLFSWVIVGSVIILTWYMSTEICFRFVMCCFNC